MILAIDQGTTGTTCLVVDDDLRIVGRGYRELPQHFPQPGWVEHDPAEIWASVCGAAADAGDAFDVVAITNQRETTLLWDRASGEPVAPAIVWQDRRTAARCRELDAELIRRRTGLVPDPYFSATKLEWLCASTGATGSRSARSTAWLVWQLTGGEHHVIDVTNASRTMLVSLETLDWDDELLALFGDRPTPPAAHRRLGRRDRRGPAERPVRRRSRDRRRPAGGAATGRVATLQVRGRRRTARARSCWCTQGTIRAHRRTDC